MISSKSDLKPYQLKCDENDDRINHKPIKRHFQALNYISMLSYGKKTFWAPAHNGLQMNSIEYYSKRHDNLNFKRAADQIFSLNSNIRVDLPTIKNFAEQNHDDLIYFMFQLKEFEYHFDKNSMYLYTLNLMFINWFEIVNKDKRLSKVYHKRCQLGSLSVEPFVRNQQFPNLGLEFSQLPDEHYSKNLNQSKQLNDFSESSLITCEYNCSSKKYTRKSYERHLLTHSVFSTLKCECCIFPFYTNKRENIKAHKSFHFFNISLEQNLIVNTVKSKIFVNCNISPLFEQFLHDLGNTVDLNVILSHPKILEYKKTYDRYIATKSKNLFGLHVNYSAFKIKPLIDILNEKRLPTLIECVNILDYDGKSTIHAKDKEFGYISRFESHKLSLNSLFFIYYNAFSTFDDNCMIEYGQISLTYFLNKTNIRHGTRHLVNCDNYKPEEFIQISIIRFVLNYFKLINKIEHCLELNRIITPNDLQQSAYLEVNDFKVLENLMKNNSNNLENWVILI